MLELKKCYVRFPANTPPNEIFSYAYKGFYFHGVEVMPYASQSEFLRAGDLGPEVGVAGFINDVYSGVRACGKDPPTPIDYPTVLRPFFGRTIYSTTLGEIKRTTDPKFVKPFVPKLFTGVVVCNEMREPGWWCEEDFAAYDDDIKVWVSDVVKFVAEWRCFVLDKEILDCRNYGDGDWSKAPNRETVMLALDAATPSLPRAFSLDFGVTPDGRTLLVEANDGFALGHYGLRSDLYARMISARWNEMIIGK